MHAFILFIILLLLISLTYIKIHLAFHRIYEDDNIEIKLLLLFGLIKFKFKIPYMDFIINKRMKPGIKGQTESKVKGKTLSEKKKIFSLKDIKDIYEKSAEAFKTYKNIINYIISKIHIDNLKWTTEIGLEDAAVTAISTGILWSIKGSFLSILCNNVNANSIEIDVKPCYNKLMFEVDLHCIIRIKIANIIIAGIKIIYTLVKNTIFKKGGEIDEPASHRRAYENHNG